MNRNTTDDMQGWVIWFKSVTFQEFTEATIHLGKFRSALPRWGGVVCLTEWIYTTYKHLFWNIFTAFWAVKSLRGQVLIPSKLHCGRHQTLVEVAFPLCISFSICQIGIYWSPFTTLSLPSPGGISKLYQWALIKCTMVLWWVTPCKCL